MWETEGGSWPYVGHLQCLDRVLKRQVRADCSESAEVVGPNQQGGSLMHGSYVQFPGHTHQEGDKSCDLFDSTLDWNTHWKWYGPNHVMFSSCNCNYNELQTTVCIKAQTKESIKKRGEGKGSERGEDKGWALRLWFSAGLRCVHVSV